MKFSSFYEIKKEQLPRQLYEEIRYLKYKYLITKLQIAITWNLFLDVYTRGCRICTTKEAELVGGKGKTDARLGTNKRFKIWYLPQNLYQLVATQWISNSAGNQIEIEKGQIDYWEKGRPRNYRVGLRLDLQVAYLFRG